MNTISVNKTGGDTAFMTPKKQQHFPALDVLKGMTIALMILVNTPGSWNSIYAPFRHAPWHGFTITDLVFPTFLFVVGISVLNLIPVREISLKAFIYLNIFSTSLNEYNASLLLPLAMFYFYG